VLRRFIAAPRRITPGSGLGLSLVAGIAHLHGFALELRDADPAAGAAGGLRAGNCGLSQCEISFICAGAAKGV
jgi:signal transduction histidine kinase